MKSKILISIVCLVLYLVPFANAAIYIDGQLYSGNILNITDSSYNYPVCDEIRLTENSVVNIYGSKNPRDVISPADHMIATGNSVVNIYYEDVICDVGGVNHYTPSINFFLSAYNNATVNFIYPQGYSFGIDDTLIAYTGLQISGTSGTIYRIYDYSGGGIYVLDPQIVGFGLHDNVIMSFIPEPATMVLLIMATPLILRKKRQS